MGKRLSPFLKWAGGKEQELIYILPNLPEEYDRYLEPFVGGGAVYFSINKKDVAINDKSYELVNLFKMIKEENQEFYDKIDGIYHNWKVLESIVENHSLLFVNKYNDYSSSKIKKSELDDFIIEFILHHANEFNGVLSTSFNINIDNFIKEIKKNLIRKTKRMKNIELEKGKLPNKDIIDNIETAFKSAYYMHFRYLYNNIEKLNMHVEVFF